MTEPLKWALVDLLRLLNEMHGGQFHTELQKIASGLGIEIQDVGQRLVTIDRPVEPIVVDVNWRKQKRATRG